jgi:hypothetical protein
MSSLGFITTAHAQSAAFTLSSPDLASGSFDNKFILNGFGCTGGNVSPALEWRNVPAGTKSLSLQIHDPDAPTGSGFWHWGVYNMPPTTTGLPQGAGNSPATLPAPAYGQHRLSGYGRYRGQRHHGGRAHLRATNRTAGRSHCTHCRMTFKGWRHP